MQSERSTIWATFPTWRVIRRVSNERRPGQVDGELLGSTDFHGRKQTIFISSFDSRALIDVRTVRWSASSMGPATWHSLTKSLSRGEITRSRIRPMRVGSDTCCLSPNESIIHASSLALPSVEVSTWMLKLQTSNNLEFETAHLSSRVYRSVQNRWILLLGGR